MNKLVFVGGISGWLGALAALGLLALLAYHWLSLRARLGPAKGSTLVGLRASAYAVLLFFLLGPALHEERLTRLRRPLFILIDTSSSMAFPAGSGADARRARMDLVKEKLNEKQPLLQRMARDHELRWYEFSTDLKPIPAGAVQTLSAQGKGTRLIEVLRELKREAELSAGVLLVSDGIANGEERTAGDLSTFPAPVFALGAGEASGFADVRLSDVRAPEFAFRNRELKIDFTLRAYGFKGRQLPVYFNRGHNLVSTRSVAVDSDSFEQRITLAYTPREIGSHSFTLSVPVQPEEQIAQNNQKDLKIEVRRDKIRLLMLSGAPSWNYRFLRMALKQDPTIDVVSFVFLRTPTDVVDVPESQLSLIPFPIDEIFLEELKNFDVVILDDFSHRSYFNILYLEKVRDFVREGGGLAVLGGSRSLDSGGYAESPLAPLLPVELEGKGQYRSGVRLRASLTPAGKSHPVTRLHPDGGANEEAWSGLPEFTTVNEVAGLRGEALLSAVGDGAATKMPLLVVGRFGKGRTLALLSDDVWRWNFIAIGNQQTPQHHLKLVRQSVRWLAQEPSFEQVQILPTGGPLAPGEKASFKIRVVKDDFTPTIHAVLAVTVTDPAGERIVLQAAPEAEEGTYIVEFTPTREGHYQLEAEGSLAGKTLGRDKRQFAVAFPYGEIDEGRPRLDILKQIAEATQGEFVPLAEWSEKTWARLQAKVEKRHPSQIVERWQIPLWSHPGVFILVLIFLSSEWWLRRRWGLL